MTRQLFILILFPGLTALIVNGQSNHSIIGIWQLFPNTNIGDTLSYNKIESTSNSKLNPSITWSFLSGGHITIENSFSNLSTSNGQLDGKDRKDTFFIQVINGDTIYTAIRAPDFHYGMSIINKKWSVSKDTLTLTDTDGSDKTEVFSILALTKNRLTIARKK